MLQGHRSDMGKRKGAIQAQKERKSKKLTIPSIGENVEQLELSYVAG